MTDGVDRRRFPRRAMELPVYVRDATDWHPATLHDLTVDGLGVLYTGTLPVGAEITVRIPSSPEIATNELRAVVLRCEAHGTLGHRVAVRLTDPNDQYLVDALSLVHGGGR